MRKIEKLLPQRPPFLFVDKLLVVNEEKIIGEKLYDSDFIYGQELFEKKKVLPPMILLESLVQCGGAGVAYSGFNYGCIWILLTIDSMNFLDQVLLPSTTIMEVKTLKLSKKVLKQTGNIYCGDKKVLNATWTCFSQ